MSLILLQLMVGIFTISAVKANRMYNYELGPPVKRTEGEETAVNEYWRFLCNEDKILSKIETRHTGSADDDRLFRFECKDSGKDVRYNNQWKNLWSTIGFVGNIHGPIVFTCPFGSLIVGFESVQNPGREDRRWKVYCNINFDAAEHMATLYADSMANTAPLVVSGIDEEDWHFREASQGNGIAYFQGLYSSDKKDRIYAIQEIKIARLS